MSDQVSTDKFAYNFSICVSPLFGSVSPKRLVEFLELTRLLGVQQIFFYDFSTSKVVRRVLRHYEGKRWVTVIPWRMPKEMSSNIWYHGQLVVHNDCLYRTMAQSVYTAFHDIDEFIVPHSKDARTYSEIIPPELPNDTCGYSFVSAFFDPLVATQLPDDVMTVFSTARTEVLTKVMVMPRRVFEVGIHHVSKQLLDPWESRPFNPERALLHHYRDALDDYDMSCDSWVKDTTIRDHYMPELNIRMATAVEALKL
ncbi:beta-1,4-galactosyltransferase galt-1-like isoform X2 [Pomacea canaliculata]|uniref:beta-1,4-galactosyltransferase galt-1-like isoform X2 n=1 Tax=Pomacea canaliculata TaxID=400727 RepID=UPI000D73E4D0|nr:beta-1,4-galactosyltransferase galt-1-like isoform X2 [Pomacea canaliculata]